MLEFLKAIGYDNGDVAIQTVDYNVLPVRRSVDILGNHDCDCLLHFLRYFGQVVLVDPSENAREHYGVVYLVLVVAAAAAVNVCAACHRLLVGYLGIGVGQGEDDGFLGHVLDMLAGHCARPGDSDEDISLLDNFTELPLDFVWVGQLGDLLLLGVHALDPAIPDRALCVHHDNIPGPMPEQQLTDGDASRTHSTDDNLDLLEFLACHPQGIDQGC